MDYLQFVSVATFEYLHARGVYPGGVFERKRAYGLIVHSPRDLELTNYVQDALKRARKWLFSGRLGCISIVIKDCVTDNVVEQLNFGVVFVSAASGDGASPTGTETLEEFKSCLVRISRMEATERFKLGSVRFIMMFQVMSDGSAEDLESLPRIISAAEELPPTRLPPPDGSPPAFIVSTPPDSSSSNPHPRITSLVTIHPSAAPFFSTVYLETREATRI